MHILIIGDGSAGKRHARMLGERGHVCTMVGLGVDHPTSMDAVVIASPPETHEEYLWAYSDMPLLCEGPVTLLPPVRHPVQMVAANWYFVRQVQELRRSLQSKRATHAHLYFDYDLAKWRSDIDYKDTCYYTSGIDNINHHEATTALALFGPAERVSVEYGRTGKSRGVDTVAVLIRHTSGTLTTINSSWHAARYHRGISVYYEDGSMCEVGWSSPQDDSVCNWSYGYMLDRWLSAVASGEPAEPGLALGFAAWRLLHGEVV